MKKGLLILLVNFVIILSNANAATFVVSSTADSDNGLAYSTPSTAENTLRKCIRLANASAGPHVINFAIAAGPFQINVTNGTYQINTSQVTVDATTQTGWSPAQNPIVILKGNGGGTCFQLNSSGSNKILGFVVQSFQYGVEINSGSNSNTVSNCWFGVDASGSSTAGTTLSENGVIIRSNSNTIGSASTFDASTRNIFSGCKTGIRLESASSNTISNNYIGTNSTGTTSLNNTEYGIYVTGGSAGSNTIGNSTSIPSNLISGNKISGIYFESASTNNNVVGNYIGTNISGTSALANGTNEPQNHHGIYVNNTQSLIIDRNVISGNIGLGIYINASAGNSSNGAKIKGNYIGTDASGMNRIANSAGGIRIDNSSNHIIGYDGLAGSSTLLQRNVISGNGGATHAVNGPATTYDMNNQCGIYLFAKDNNVRSIKISGNYIGVKSSGIDTLGNKASGVKFEAANWTTLTCDLNTIGGTDSRFRNVIGGNGFNDIQVAHGILLKEKNTKTNTITSNFIGIGADGSSPVGNRQDGVSFLGAQGNTVGGVNVENVISNNQWGIFLQSNFGGVQSSGNTLAGNFIGTDSTGLSSVNGAVQLGNGRRAVDTDGGGIGIQHGSTANIVGNATSYNVVAGNYLGIVFRNSGFGGPATSNIVQNNLVGVGKNGTTAIPNSNSGILISGGCSSNTIGASSASLRNVIANNGKYGIELDSAQSNTIAGNYIGLDKNANSASNISDGINIHNGSSKNIIGGIAGAGNQIGNNGGNGIGFSTPNAVGSTLNAINNNSIYCNSGRGIVLNSGNASYAAPTFSGAPANFNVTGPAGSWIELYSLDGCNDCSTTSNTKLQGKTLVASGASPLNYVPTGGKTNLDFTATASSGVPGVAPLYHNTSEFSVCQVLCATPTSSNAGSDQNICNAVTATLNANSPTSGTGTWTVISGVASITDPSLNNSGVTGLATNGAATLRWTVSTGAGCTASTDDVTLTTNASPSIADAGTDINLCQTSGTTLAGIDPASGTGLWTIVGSSTATISFPLAFNSAVTNLPAGTTTLKWTISNGVCPPTEDEVVITRETPSTVADAGTDNSICSANGVLAANAPANGTGTWTIVGASTATIDNPNQENSTISNLPIGTTTFKWTIATSGGICSSTEDEVVITRDEAPSAANAGADNSFCSTDGTLTGNSPTIGVGVWSIVGTSAAIISTPSAFDSDVTNLPAGTTTFKWTVSNGSCSPSEDEVIITRDVPVTIADAGADNSICSANGSLSSNAPTSGTGTWTIVGASTATIDNPNQANSTISNLPLGTTTFKWTISGGGTCSSSEDEVSIARDESPSAAQATDFTNGICASTATLMANNPTIGTGLWTVVAPGTATIDNPDQATSGISNLPVGVSKFVWTISNGACNASTDTVDVTRNTITPPAIIISGDRTICSGTIPIQANAESTAGLPGKWTSKPANVTFDDDTNPLTTVNGFLSDTTKLYWTLTGPCGTTSDSIYVAIKTSDFNVSAASDDDSLCVGKSANINVKINGGTGTNYNYYFTSSDNSFSSVTTNTSVEVSPVSTGWTYYYITAIDNQNCQSLNIEVDSLYSLNHQTLVVPNLITPNNDGHNDCFIIRDINGFDIYPGSDFQMFNRWGEAVYKNNQYKNGDFCGNNLSDGVYYYYLQTGCGKNEIKGWLHIINNSEESSNK